MKKIIRITLIFLFLTSFVNTNGVNISSEDNPSVSISKNDLLILSDVHNKLHTICESGN